MDYEEVEGQRSGSILYKVDDGHYYVKHMGGSDKPSTWLRCKLYKTEKCHGSAKIDNAKKKVANFKDHSHGLAAYKMEAVVLKNKIKKECKTNTEDTANKIFKRLTRGDDTPGVHYDKMASSLYKSRKELLPDLPKDAAEFSRTVQDHPETLGKYHVSEVTVDDEPVGDIYIHPHMLRALKNYDRTAFDGTFKTVPRVFDQLFIIHIVVGNKFFGAIFVLMTRRLEDHYRAVLIEINRVCPRFLPTDAIGDWELGPRNAFLFIFPRLRTKGCFFHTTQNQYKHILELRLSPLYRTDRSFRKWVNRMMALALLPPDLIMGAFDILILQRFINFPASAQRALQKFKIYFRTEWIENKDFNELSVFGQDVAANNGAESCNAMLGRAINARKPNPWYFQFRINEIMDDQVKRHRDFIDDPTSIRGRRPQDTANIEFRRKSERALIDQKITPLQFLTRVSRTFKSQIARMNQQRPRHRGESSDESDPSSSEDEDEQPQQPQLPMCTLCLQPRTDTYAFVPCGHATFCGTCSGRIIATRATQQPKSCPTCSRDIDFRMQTFN